MTDLRVVSFSERKAEAERPAPSDEAVALAEWLLGEATDGTIQSLGVCFVRDDGSAGTRFVAEAGDFAAILGVSTHLTKRIIDGIEEAQDG